MKLFELKDTGEVNQLLGKLNSLFQDMELDVEFSNHFIGRVLARESNATVSGIVSAFARLKSKYSNQLITAKSKKGYAAVLQDGANDLNIVFGVKPTKKGHHIFLITMKTESPEKFKTSDPIFKV